MYTYFKVRNFRCFQELEFDDLALVNLIAGANNVGKTALLEAMFLLYGVYNPEIIVNLNVLRGLGEMDLTLGRWAEHPLSSFFNQFDVSKIIELTGGDTVAAHRSLRLRAVAKPVVGYIKDESDWLLKVANALEFGLELEYKEAEKQGNYYIIMDRDGSIHVNPPLPIPSFQAFFQGARVHTSLSEQATLYGNLELYNKQDQVLEALTIIEPRLRRLAVVSVAGNPMLHGDIDIGRLVPLPIMGGGIVCLANLAVKISNAPNGVVLVDEIENGLHHSVILKVWKAIALAARQSNTQIFATTHSWECIRAAHEAFASEEEYNFRLHRLDRMNGEITAVTYDQESLAASLKHGMEVR